MAIHTAVPLRSPSWRPHPSFRRDDHLRALADLRRPRPIAWVVANLSTWLVIAGAIVMAERWPWMLPLALLVVASRQHALGVLMHDGAHGTISRTPSINLLLANVMAAWPLGITTEGFRRSHLAHHAHTHTDRDPDLMRKLALGADDWTTPMPRRRGAWLLAKDVLGRGLWNMCRRMRWYGRGGSIRPAGSAATPIGWTIGRAGFAFALATALTLTGTWLQFALYWLVPLLFLVPALLRVRSLAEHFGLPHEHALSSSRDCDAPWLERQLFGPFGINWHLTHHLFPDVPFPNLRLAHARLRRDPGYAAFGARRSSYFGVRDSVLAAITGQRGPDVDHHGIHSQR